MGMWFVVTNGTTIIILVVVSHAKVDHNIMLRMVIRLVTVEL